MAKKPQILKEIQNKELPEVNYAYQKTISYSQMSMYRSCPHKWELQYKEGHYNNDLEEMLYKAGYQDKEVANMFK